MKKLVSVLGLVALVAGPTGIAAAAPAHGGHGAPPFHGPAASPAARPSFRGPAAVRQDFHGHREWHRDRGRVFVGVGPVFPWWEPVPVYGPPPPVVIEEPPVYVQPPQPGYWYYCPSAGAYYPTVPTCPEPWVPVPPAR